MTYIRFLTGVVLILLTFTACQEGAVVFVPPTETPDVLPAPYTHPSGAFSIRVLADWGVFQQETDALAGVSFTPPGAESPVLIIGVINLAVPMETLDIINQYQNIFRPDAERYSEQERQAMGDGSWRLVGLWRPPAGDVQQVNTFFQRVGDTIVLIETRLPSDPALMAAVEVAVNTFTLNADNTLTPAGLSELALTSPTGIRLMSFNAWRTADNVYYITGEVANFGALPVANVPVSVLLLDADGAELASAFDRTMGYRIAPGDYAPFSLRFGAGQPPEATRFVLNIGQPEDAPPDASDSLQLTENFEITAEGHLLITGTVSNTGTSPVYRPSVFVTVFDAAGRVIAAGFTLVTEDALSPAQSIDFVLRIQDMGGIPSNTIINVQALDRPR